MIRVILIILFLLQTCFAQQQDVISSSCPTSGHIYGYPISSYPTDTLINIHKRDLIATWFIAPASGYIDTIFCSVGDVNGVDTLLMKCVAQISRIGPNLGPGISPYPPPPQNWGHFINTHDSYSGIGAFWWEATDTTWYSTVSGSVPSIPPFGSDICFGDCEWGGYKIVKPNQINYHRPMDASFPVIVMAGENFVIFMRQWALPAYTIQFGASHTRVPEISRAWVFRAKDSLDGPDSKKGWRAIGGVNINIWYSMTITGNLPPNIISYDQLGDTNNAGSRLVTAQIEACPPLPSDSAGIQIAEINYKVDNEQWKSTHLNYVSGNIWSGEIPNMYGSVVQYFIRVVDKNGMEKETPPIVYHNTFTSWKYTSGWNLLSLPMMLYNNTAKDLFPNASSSAFVYTGSYVMKDSIFNGVGYWVKFKGDNWVGGADRFSDTIDVSSGWNMIGSISNTVDVLTIQTIPPDIIMSQFYYYDDIYKSTTELVPFKGYWVKVKENGNIILISNSVKK
ncbi:MAG: hypothetical protein QME52_02005 [Bacteroidota bacterium]|nr:hypothetical protein [Bacteroidota bacterium]